MNKSIEEKKLINYLSMISGSYIDKIQEASAYQDSLVKPPKSLGILEDISIKFSGITGTLSNNIDKKIVLVFASDNKVVEEGVSSAPQSVTLSQSINLTKGITGCGAIAKALGSDVRVVDVGINGVYNNAKIINKKLMMGTNNIRYEKAFDRETCIKAILIGIEEVLNLKDEYDIFGVGEMGIGNTTTSSAVLSVLTGLEVDKVTGKGGGITDEAFINKKNVIKDAINNKDINRDDVIDVISSVGGLDIASMCGAFIGAAISRKPIVIDGFISVVAALCAYKLNKDTVAFMFPSHESFEVGYKYALSILGLKPLFNLEMRLGEGSGCPIAFKIIEASLGVMNYMETFEGANINDDYLREIREGDKFSVK